MRAIAGAIGMAVASIGLAAAAVPQTVKAGVDAWQRGDFAGAVATWRPLAVAGDADAQFNIGQAYKLGRGVAVDTPVAAEWFRKAAVQGHQQAETNYALALFQDRRFVEAAPWLEKAAARGEPRAQLVLGTMLFNGDGIARDYPRAYALITRASQAGLPSASRTLAQMDSAIGPTDRQRGTELAADLARWERIAMLPTADRGTNPPPAAAPAIPRAVATVAPSRTPPRATKVAPAQPSLAGRWRIQLGAFRDKGNAQDLWAHVRGKLAGARPSYVAAGGLTRLQATGFADRSAAQRACRAVGGACLPVAP